MQRTLCNHHDRVIMVQSRVESRQGCLLYAMIVVHTHETNRKQKKEREEREGEVKSGRESFMFTCLFFPPSSVVIKQSIWPSG